MYHRYKSCLAFDPIQMVCTLTSICMVSDAWILCQMRVMTHENRTWTHSFPLCNSMATFVRKYTQLHIWFSIVNSFNKGELEQLPSANYANYTSTHVIINKCIINRTPWLFLFVCSWQSWDHPQNRSSLSAIIRDFGFTTLACGMARA